MSDDLFSDIESNPNLSLHDAVNDPEYDSRNRKIDERRRIHGFSGLSWFVVLILAFFMMVLAIMSSLDQARSDISQVELLEIKSAGQQILAFESDSIIRDALEKGFVSVDEQIALVVDRCNAGPFESRFGYTILVSETRGSKDAIAALDDVMNRARELGVEPNDDQSRIERILRSQFNSELNPDESLSAEDREFLISRLGWVSKLLIFPRSVPSLERETMIAEAVSNTLYGFTFIGIAFLMVLVGIGVAGIMAWLAVNRLRGRVSDDSRCGPVYIETFAIWFALFIGIQLLAGAFGLSNGVAMISAMVLPLVALGWPMFRGVSFSDMRQDIGVKIGNPIIEFFCGVVCYLAALPFIVAGLLIVQLLSALWYQFTAPGEFAPHGVPHPIARDVMNGDPMWTLMFMLLTTAIAAPFVEELMFRGVLYRHLRDASHHMARWMSVIFSAFVNGLVFAAIHPQGVVAIPALTMLAFAFCLARQWRNSLIAPMTMHALHNSVITYALWRMMF